MLRVPSLLRRFKSDERGAFIVIFGVLAIVLIATSGAVVDYTAIEQARTRAQVALDTAALGLQPEIYKPGPPTGIQTKAQDLLVQQLNTSSGQIWGICTNQAIPPCAQIDSVTTDTANGTLHLEASLEIPTAFVTLIGIPSMRARLVSEATRKKLNLEVVMVLDQSNSMERSNRMMNLVAASKCVVNILFSSGCNDNAPNAANSNVRMGLVPFTMLVNVGTNHANASWMDRKGVSDIANDNFDNDDNDATAYTGPIDRIALFNQIKNASWGGCVEARKSPYDTDDTAPTTSDPDTLFVPLFAPDEPSGYVNNYIANDSPASCNQTIGLSPRELQERICKYTNSTATGLSTVSAKGPNSDCPANPITPLTRTKSAVLSAINSMASQGGTNIHAGAIWGLHVLSPTEPFTEGTEYDPATSKVMIIMTDGENTAYKSSNMNGSTYYSYYGYPWNQRMGTTSWTDAQLETEMDTRLVTTCTNAKAAGITIYTVGLSTGATSDQTKVETMLRNCSSGEGYYYFPNVASDLIDVFRTIAEQLGELRLSL